MSEIRDSILRAIDLLRTDGWVQKRAQSGRKHCMVHALMVGAQHQKNPARFEATLAHVSRSVLPLGHTPLSTWNDVPGRTLDEVIAVLIKAAEIGEPEKRRVLIPAEVPAAPLLPDSPLWSEPAPEDPNPIKAPERVPA